ncbi:exported hypothetical protein [Candidatus Desulfarcum epimagneticum]|uniref:Uncharacterized protein n=1 Tax=uncultured Desulfobacteraceae bacterium TaxID=218296 RepID=A0A484HJJ7_9BACT|nr:exported hypothetical protein [uncultured Desulfobacteraceae bacterium]
MRLFGKKSAAFFLIVLMIGAGCAKSDDDVYHDMLLDGVASLNLDKPEKALGEFSSAIDFNPRKPGGYLGRGNALNTMGRHHEAIEAYNQALAIDPEMANAYVNRGVAHARLDRHEKAAADFKKGLELDPEIDDPPGFVRRLFEDIPDRDKGIRKYLEDYEKLKEKTGP